MKTCLTAKGLLPKELQQFTAFKRLAALGYEEATSPLQRIMSLQVREFPLEVMRTAALGFEVAVSSQQSISP